MSGPGFVITKFNDIEAPGGNPFSESLTDSIGLDDAPVHEGVQLQGTGANLPAGGGWQLFCRLDVTQPDGSSYNSTALATQGTAFDGWNTPDADGGAYWNLDDGTYKYMLFRWEVGAANEGRVASRSFTDSDGAWNEMYVRWVARTNWPHTVWPSNTVKMIDWDPGNNTFNWSNLQLTGGLKYYLGNTTPEFRTDEGTLYEPDPVTDWAEAEWHAVFNTTTSPGNGTVKLWVGEVGSTSEVTAWTRITGPGNPESVSQPTGVTFTSVPAGIITFYYGPYRGGQGGTIGTTSDIHFAMCEVYVR